MKKKKVWMIVGSIAAVFLLTGAIWQSFQLSLKTKKCQKQLFAMDTYMEFTAYGKKREQAVTAAMEEVKRLDALLSAQDTQSEVYALNEEKELLVSPDLGELILRGKEIYEKTGGLFDDTIYPVMKLWGFPTGEYHVPTETELTDEIAKVDGSKVVCMIQDENSSDQGNTPSPSSKMQVTLGEDQKIDLGGIAKGYTGEKLTEIFREYDISSALVSLGGNVQAVGTKPDGSYWKVGIRDPKGSQQDYVGVLEVSDEAVVTSGGYERYFEENGQTYIHILDPRTGYPVEGDLESVTIVSKDGTMADGLSTALYIMGYEEACVFWQKNREEFETILITNDGKIHVSEGLQERFQSDGSWNVILAEGR